MYIEKDDPRLIDFALGELGPEDAKQFEAALALPENAEARAEVIAIHRLTEEVGEALEMRGATLDADQRDAVLNAAEKRSRGGRYHFQWSHLRFVGVAAVLAVASAIYLSALERAREAARRSSSPFVMGEAGSSGAMPDTRQEEAITELRYQSEPTRGETPSATGPAGVPPAPLPEPQAEAGRPEETQTGLQNVYMRGVVQIRGIVYEDDVESLRSDEPMAGKVGSRSRMGVRADFTDNVSAFIEMENYDVWGEDFRGNSVSEAPASAPSAPQAEGAPQDWYWQDMPVGSASNAGPLGGSARSAPAAPAPAPTQAQRDQLGALGYFSEPMQWSPEAEAAMGLCPPPSWIGRPVNPGNESYAPIVENPFTTVTQAPLSTFGVDVDTASYTNVRRFLEQGQWPPADAVRIEELINYFDYRYAPPQAGSPFAVDVDLAACAWAPRHLLARIGLQGQVISKEARPPVNLVFLLDVSGSMDAPNRLPLVKASMQALLRELDGRDRVGIVTYAGDARVVLDSTSASEPAAIRAAIDGLRAGGSTNGGAGIEQAYAMAAQHFIKGAANRVVLATDGDFNVGVTNRGALIQMIEAKRDTGIFLTVLGFGMGNIKDATLEQLANKGNGNFAYIDDYRAAQRVLVDQLMGTLITIAKDVKIQVEFNPAQVAAYRLIGYENRALAPEDFNDDRKDAGEIGAGHQVTALYEIVPAGVPVHPQVDDLRYQTPPAAAQTRSEPVLSDELMTVKLRYKHPDGAESARIDLPVARSAVTTSPDEDFRFASAVAAWGMLLRNSAHKGAATLDLVRELAESAAGSDAERQAFLGLVSMSRSMQR